MKKRWQQAAGSGQRVTGRRRRTTGNGQLIANNWPALITSLCFLAPSCDNSTGPSDRVASITVVPQRVLTTTVGQQAQYAAMAWSTDESIVGGVTITWEVLNPTVASIDANGLVTGLADGVTVVRARVGTVVGDATFEVYIDPNARPFVPSQSYFGRRDYVEYMPGDLPLIISAPHGGSLTPEEMSDRTFGITVTDRNTRDMALQARDSIFARTGRYPHMIISHLHRSKLDPNREIIEAAQGDIFAEQAWREFHGFIQIARGIVETDHQRGLYLDYHGHGHPVARVELGYLLAPEDLRQSDVVMNGAGITNKTSIRALINEAAATTAELIRGPQSFGTLLENANVPAVPSTSQPDPGADEYFTGGFNTQQYGSRDGGSVSGIQIEAPFPGVRDTEVNRGIFAGVMTTTIETYLLIHFGIDWHSLPNLFSSGTILHAVN